MLYLLRFLKLFWRGFRIKNCKTMKFTKRIETHVEKGNAGNARKRTLEPVGPWKEEDLRSKVVQKPEWHQTRSLRPGFEVRRQQIQSRMIVVLVFCNDRYLWRLSVLTFTGVPILHSYLFSCAVFQIAFCVVCVV